MLVQMAAELVLELVVPESELAVEPAQVSEPEWVLEPEAAEAAPAPEFRQTLEGLGHKEPKAYYKAAYL